MRKIRDVLRLHHDLGLSVRQIASSLNIGRTTVSDYLSRARVCSLDWPLPELSDEALQAQLFPGLVDAPAVRQTPDWPGIHRELQRRSVTLQLLWEEYKAADPDGYQYSRFCDLYRRWRGTLSPSMRQHHAPGEKLFVDYAGHTAEVIDPATGEIRTAEIFVAVLGASNYTFAEATWSQSLPDWIGSHQRAFAFFGGVPQVVVPDNLRSGVTRAGGPEPEINRSYLEMANHYGVAILPARVRKPRDKAKAEAGVQLVERWILAALRNRRFFSLEELNRAIGELLVRLNDKAFKQMPGSRRCTFEELDRPALKALPVHSWEFAQYKLARVHVDYHIQFERHCYSVPHRLIGKQIELRVTERVVECFYKGERVASHRRDRSGRGFSTVAEHMPRAHREYASWTPQRLMNWAGETGPACRALIERLLYRHKVPQQGFRSALGILRLEKSYGKERLEAACARALEIDTTSWRSISSMLKRGLERKAGDDSDQLELNIQHHNIRGPAFYH